MSSTDIAAQIPEVIEADGDKFVVQSVLGRGGMGIIYKAHQQNLDRIVALKMLIASNYADPHATIRLRREAMAAAQLTHPNIVKVHSMSTFQHQPFIVMEYVEGRTISDLLGERKTLPADETTRIISQVLDALQAIHDAGFVHRDIKPSNIIVTADGIAKLMDFGIAKQVLNNTQQRMTQTGAMLGSPWYMSPEQCTGGEIDSRSDIYSLGCTMFHMLSGHEPYNADSALEVMYKHMHDQVATLSDVVGPAAAAVVAKAMEKDRTKRYQSAQEFKSALQSCQFKQGSARRRSRRFCSPWALWVVAPAIAATLGCIGYKAWMDAQPEPPEQVFPTQTSAMAAELEGELNRLHDDTSLTPAQRKAKAADIVARATRLYLHARAQRMDIVAAWTMADLGRAVFIYNPDAGTRRLFDALDVADEGLSSDDWREIDAKYGIYERVLGQLREANRKEDYDKAFARGMKGFESLPKTSQKRTEHNSYFLDDLAGWANKRQDYDKELELVRKAIDMRNAHGLGTITPNTNAYQRLAGLCVMLGRWPQALAAAKEGIPKTEISLASKTQLYYATMHRSGLADMAATACSNMHDRAGCENYYKLAVDTLWEIPAEATQGRLANMAMMQAHRLVNLADYAAAYKMAKKAVTEGGPKYLQNPAAVNWSLCLLTSAHLSGNYKAAAADAEMMLPFAKQYGSPSDQFTVRVLGGSAMSIIGNPDQAEEWLLAAKPLEPSAVAAQPKMHFLFHRFLANVSAQKGHLEQARESFARGIKLAQKLKTEDPNGAKGIEKEYGEFVKAHGA